MLSYNINPLLEGADDARLDSDKHAQVMHTCTYSTLNCTSCNSNFTGHGVERGDSKVFGLLMSAMAVYSLSLPTALCTIYTRAAKVLRMLLISALPLEYCLYTPIPASSSHFSNQSSTL